MMIRMDEALHQPLRIALEYLLLHGGLALVVALAFREYTLQTDPRVLLAGLTARAWSVHQVVLVFGVLFSLYFAASFLGLFFYEEDIPLVRLVAALVIQGVLLATMGLVVKKRGGWSEGMGMGTSELKGLLWSPIFYLASIPFIIVAGKAWHILLGLIYGTEVALQEVARILSQGGLSFLEVGYLISAILIAPVVEEMLYRGALFPWLANTLGVVGATVMTSILFALMHWHVASLVPLALMSAAACIAYWRTGSLWTSIGLHMIFNAVTILALNIKG